MLGQVDPAWLATLHLRATGARRSRATEAGLSEAEYVLKAEANIRNWVSTAQVRIRIREPELLRFLRDGHYKTMAETGTSGGGVSRIEKRFDVEHLILAIPREAEPAARPISAYLSGSDEFGAIGTYGDIVLELADSVRTRTWFLFGDLIDTPRLTGGQTLAPVPLTEPSIDAASYRRNVVLAASLSDACGEHGYAEALVYGGLDLSELTAVRYPKSSVPAHEVNVRSQAGSWTLS